jgi:DNA polymerase III epsilon subunit-like protein
MMENYRRLTIDTETSGQRGVPLWHPNHRLIQISCLCSETREWYKSLISYGDDFYLHPQNVDLHKIGMQDLIQMGKPGPDVMRGLVDFANKGDKKVLLVAHNAPFDWAVIRFAIQRELGLQYGRGGKDLGWLCFDTLHWFRDNYPDLGLGMDPASRPYSLEKLCVHFLGIKPEGMHNADKDVEMLDMLFERVILPNLVNWQKYVCGDGVERSRMVLVKQLPGFGDKRVEKLVGIVNHAFNLDDSGQYHTFPTTDQLFSVAHLLVYGEMRYKQHLRGLGREPRGEELNEWFEVLAHIEILLREEPMNINCDTTISHVLAAVAGLDIVDLTRFTMREDGNKDFFPPLRGTRRAFYPLQITDQEARLVLQEHGWGTIGEMLACYLTSHITITTIQEKFNACVCPNILNQKQIFGLDETFKVMLKYGA